MKAPLFNMFSATFLILLIGELNRPDNNMITVNFVTQASKRTQKQSLKIHHQAIISSSIFLTAPWTNHTVTFKFYFVGTWEPTSIFSLLALCLLFLPLCYNAHHQFSSPQSLVCNSKFQKALQTKLILWLVPRRIWQQNLT